MAGTGGRGGGDLGLGFPLLGLRAGLAAVELREGLGHVGPVPGSRGGQVGRWVGRWVGTVWVLGAGGVGWWC